MKKKLTLIVLLVGVVLLAVGLSYAYFSAKITNNENTSTIISEAGTLSITLDGGASFNVGSILPGLDAWATKTITLTGNNSSKGNMPYSIKIVVDNNTFSTDAISYSITGTNTSNSGVVAPSVEYISINETTTIGSGFFEKGNNKVHTYTIRMYFLDTNTDQSSDMRAIFKAHIEIEGTEAEKPAPAGWWKASGSTLLGAIRDNSVLHTDETGMTVPGEQIATTNEGLRMTLDDYGESFYFRGNVPNNYVQFAGKCWKIVRITGSGAIKLFLHNNDSDDCSQHNIINIYYSENSFTTNNAYIGLMYGNRTSTDFSNKEGTGVHDNITNSYMLTRLETWYDDTFSENQKDMLADVIWCNDMSLSATTSGNGIGTSETFYGFKDRLHNPTLICPSVGYQGKISKFTASDIINGNGKLKTAIENTMPVEYKYYKIGLITADEVIYAGGANNYRYYLYYGSSTFWTMTPAVFEDGKTKGYFVNSSVNLERNNYSNSKGLRPMVALLPTVKATYDKTSDYKPGTINNPYVITVPQTQS